MSDTVGSGTTLFYRSGQVGSWGSTGCAILAPQSHTIQTRPSSTAASRSPQRRCSWTKASRAASSSGIRSGYSIT
jgi:hypothetical protein